MSSKPLSKICISDCIKNLPKELGNIIDSYASERQWRAVKNMWPLAKIKVSRYDDVLIMHQIEYDWQVIDKIFVGVLSCGWELYLKNNDVDRVQRRLEKLAKDGFVECRIVSPSFGPKFLFYNYN